MPGRGREGSANWSTALFYIGLAVFTVTVVGYTLFGRLSGGGLDRSLSERDDAGGRFSYCLFWAVCRGRAAWNRPRKPRSPETGSADFAFGPGFDPEHKGARVFLPLGLAFSFFWVWVYSGVGSPAGMVRVMGRQEHRGDPQVDFSSERL